MAYPNSWTKGLDTFTDRWNKKYDKLVMKYAGTYPYVIVPAKSRKEFLTKVRSLKMVPNKSNGMNRIWMPPKTKKTMGYSISFGLDKFGKGFMLKGDGISKDPRNNSKATVLSSKIKYVIVSKSSVIFLFANVKKISLQEAKDRNMFGPVYHGTDETARQAIKDKGFKIFIGPERSGNVSHGYESKDYYGGMPPPIHTLSFGIYMTTSKSIAKQFAMGTTKGMKTYFLDVPKLETINFGANSTMMKWWNKNGYNPTPYEYDAKERLKETINLTKKLKSKWDAVWFKGKGLYKLLDGDQIAVFDPKNIYEIDKTLAKDFEIGSRIRRKEDGILGTILRKEKVNTEKMLRDFPMMKNWLKPGTKFRFNVKWRKGGTDFNVCDVDVEPAPLKRKK